MQLKLLLIIIVLLNNPAAAQAQPYILEEAINGAPLGVHIQYMEDRTGKAQIAEISALTKGWTVSKKDVITIGYSPSAWWFRFTLDNPAREIKEILLEVDNSRFERIDLHAPDGKGSFATFNGGTDYHFKTRDIVDKNFVYHLMIQPGQSTCYLRIQSTNSINFMLKSWTLNRFMEARSREMPVLWMYYGLMIVMLLYNMPIFFATRDRAYLYCSFFILCYIFMIFSVNGLGFQYLWPGSGWMEQRSAYFFLNFGIIWLFQFIRSFLETKKDNPVSDRIIIYSIIVPALSAAILCLLVDKGGLAFLKQAVQIWSLYYSAFTMCFLIFKAANGSRQAMFALAGFIVLVIGGILFILKNFSVLPVNVITIWSWQTGSAMMIILFSLGLFDKFNVMKLALQKSEEELLNKNKKLAALNEEMEAANEELMASNEEFEAMNHELVESQEQLIQNENKFRTMLERFPLPVLVIRERDVDYMNESFGKTFGLNRIDAPVVAKIIDQLFPSREDRNAFTEEYWKKTEKIRPGEVIHFGTKKMRGAKGPLDIDLTLSLVNNMTIMIFSDITERKLMEEERERLISLIEATSDFVSMADSSENIIFINAPGKKMLGMDVNEEVKTKRIRDIVPEWAYRLMHDEGMPAAAANGIWLGETALLTRDGNEIPVSQVIMSHRSGLEPVEFYSTIMRDITERKRTQELMVLTEKMTTVGGLAAGMAHEINNPLGVILQGAQMATLRLEAGTEADRSEAEAVGIDPAAVRQYSQRRGVFDYLQAVRDAGERAALIVSNMLQFSRRGNSIIAVEDIHGLIEKALNIAMNDYSLKKKYDFRKITLIRDYDKTIPGVFCCGTEIEQVILNLLKNASQAMSEITDEKFSPVIGIRTFAEDGMVVIEISDNGPGIPQETQKRIFEPFYTTKKTGEGTGLGLSVSYYIVTNNHKGSITVRSLEGEGTAFIVKLPIGSA